ncbi:MAG: hypothetical protein KC468_17760, partial [Myxococcales bacterium]|nr:hypothetical protein [Myxococcales bacterium]
MSYQSSYLPPATRAGARVCLSTLFAGLLMSCGDDGGESGTGSTTAGSETASSSDSNSSTSGAPPTASGSGSSASGSSASSTSADPTYSSSDPPVCVFSDGEFTLTPAELKKWLDGEYDTTGGETTGGATTG